MEKNEPQRLSMVFYRDWYNMLQAQTPEVKLKIYDAIMLYAFEGEENTDPALAMVFSLIKQRLDSDTSKWEGVRQKRSMAGKKHKGNQYSRKTEQNEQTEQVSQNETNETNGTNGTVNVNGNVIGGKPLVDNNNLSLHTQTNTRVREVEFSELEEKQARWFADKWNELRNENPGTRTAQFTTLTRKRKGLIFDIVRTYTKDGKPQSDIILRGMRYAMTSERAQGRLAGQPAPADLNYLLEHFVELVERTF